MPSSYRSNSHFVGKVFCALLVAVSWPMQATRGDEPDGAIFVLAFGTNPELMLLIETDGSEWKFAAGRLSAADSIELKLDDTPVWQGPPVKHTATSPYTASIAPIMIPGFDANGLEVEE